MAIGAALTVSLFLLVRYTHDVLLSAFLGILSILTLIGWIAVSVVSRHMDQMDEADLYDGGDRAGVVIFLPAGLSLTWIFACVVVLASRLLLQQPLMTSALQWQAIAFAGATVLGIGLCMSRSCWLAWLKSDDV